MRIFWLLTLLSLSVGTVATADTGATVTPLYDSSTWIPGFLIPLKVSGTLVNSSIVQNPSVTNSGGADCRIMADPFVQNLFLVRCSANATVTAHFNLISAGQTILLNYGPFNVQYPSGYQRIVPLADANPGTGGGGSSGPDPNIAAGQQLFATYCINCHSPSSKAGKSTAAISSALSTVGQMSGLKSALSSSDIQKLSAYLGSL